MGLSPYLGFIRVMDMLHEARVLNCMMYNEFACVVVCVRISIGMLFVYVQVINMCLLCVHARLFNICTFKCFHFWHKA